MDSGGWQVTRSGVLERCLFDRTGTLLGNDLRTARRSATLPKSSVSWSGTDISTKVVAQAETAVYPKEEIVGIPVEMRASSLLSSKSGDGRCRIAPDLRRRTEWRVGNLNNSGSLNSIIADVAFLRNVLIYFDGATQRAVLKNVLSRISL